MNSISRLEFGKFRSMVGFLADGSVRVIVTALKMVLIVFGGFYFYVTESL